jgi:NADH-quinone oxidoreductase subunit M
MVILAALQQNFWYAFLAATTLIFGAAYTLWMVKRVFFGAVVHKHVAKLQDLNQRELLIMLILAVLVIGVGVYPKVITDITQVTSQGFLEHMAQSKLPVN